MSSNSFNELINVILSKAVLVSETEDSRKDMGELFMKALKNTTIEVQKGADSDQFAELTIINLIVLGDKEGYSAEEMRGFIEKLKADDEDYDDYDTDEDIKE